MQPLRSFVRRTSFSPIKNIETPLALYGDGLNYAAPAKFPAAFNVIISTPAVPLSRSIEPREKKACIFTVPLFCSRSLPCVASVLITRRRNSIPSLFEYNESFWTFVRAIESRRGEKREREGMGNGRKLE